MRARRHACTASSPPCLSLSSAPFLSACARDACACSPVAVPHDSRCNFAHAYPPLSTNAHCVVHTSTHFISLGALPPRSRCLRARVAQPPVVAALPMSSLRVLLLLLCVVVSTASATPSTTTASAALSSSTTANATLLWRTQVGCLHWGPGCWVPGFSGTDSRYVHYIFQSMFSLCSVLRFSLT